MSVTDTDGGQGESRPAGDGGASPKEMVASATQTVKQEAQSFAAEAQDKARDALEQKKATATRTLGEFANAVRKAGDELARGDQSMAGRLVLQAADGLEGLSRSVADKRPEEWLDGMRDFGRRNPTAFIAGSVLVGIALGRFLRSSSSHARPRQAAPGPEAAAAWAPGAAEEDYLPSPAEYEGLAGGARPSVDGSGAEAGGPGIDEEYRDRPRFGSEL